VWQPFCEDGPNKHGVARTGTRKGGIGIRKEDNRGGGEERKMCEKKNKESEKRKKKSIKKRKWNITYKVTIHFCRNRVSTFLLLTETGTFL